MLGNELLLYDDKNHDLLHRRRVTQVVDFYEERFCSSITWCFRDNTADSGINDLLQRLAAEILTARYITRLRRKFIMVLYSVHVHVVWNTEVCGNESVSSLIGCLESGAILIIYHVTWSIDLNNSAI